MLLMEQKLGYSGQVKREALTLLRKKYIFEVFVKFNANLIWKLYSYQCDLNI